MDAKLRQNELTPDVAVRRARRLGLIALACVVTLLAKVLLTIVYEYRWYFPPNFEDSAFLTGRQEYFDGVYRAAFYGHIISGPVAVVLGFILLISGGRLRVRRLHRWLGRSQFLIVMLVIVPSGLVMATHAFTGPIAGWGFASLSLATGACMVIAVQQARSRKFASHRRWATRCFILLCSPLLLRLMSGAVIVFQLESDLTYRLSAWLSWLIPLAIYEAWWRRSARQRLNISHQN